MQARLCTLAALVSFAIPCEARAQQNGQPQPTEKTGKTTLPGPDQLVTKSFRLKWIGPRHRQSHSGPRLLDTLRDALTPDVGSVDYHQRWNMFLVKDTEAVVQKIGRIVGEADVGPVQVFVDVKVVTAWSPQIAHFGATTNDRPAHVPVRVFTAAQARAAMRLLRTDAKARILQSPRLIALDRQEASLVVGAGSGRARTVGQRPRTEPLPRRSVTVDNASSRVPRFELTLVPSVVRGTDKVVIEVKTMSGLSVPRSKGNARKVTVRSGQTIVMQTTGPSETTELVLLTPQIIARSGHRARIAPKAASAGK